MQVDLDPKAATATHAIAEQLGQRGRQRLTVGGFAYSVGVILVLVFAVATLREILRGRINLTGLLDDLDGHRAPERLLALLSVVLMCIAYLGLVLEAPAVFPEVPTALLATLGIGGSAYITAKAFPIAARAVKSRLREAVFGHKQETR